MQPIIENLTRDYLQAFSSKNSAELFRMFSDNVELLDWEVNLHGRDDVMKNNQDLFNSVGQIKITPEIVAVYGLTAMVKILVEIDNISLRVVDIITFDNAGKIIKVEAYKQ